MGWTKLLKKQLWNMRTNETDWTKTSSNKRCGKNIKLFIIKWNKTEKIANFLLSSWKNDDAEKYNTQYFQQM